MTLAIENLSLQIGNRPILREVSLSVARGEVLGIVGESGSGKSLTALAAMQLLPRGSRTTGSIRLEGEELMDRPDGEMQRLRGRSISMIFQEPMTALNPVRTIGEQVAETARIHLDISRGEAEDLASRQLERVGLPSTRVPLSRYPHELSGGQRQRVLIAAATILQPTVLIADEPTTALDVTLQAQVLTLLRGMVDETGMALVLITHDLAVVAETADRLAVMREGEVVDGGSVTEVLGHISHPYTATLASASTHRPHRTPPKETAPDLLDVNGISRAYPVPRKSLLTPGIPHRAVDDVSFSIPAGRSVGLVGESGCGKSTLARIVLGLDAPTSGTVTFDNTLIEQANTPSMQAVRRRMQVVFQDPFASFDPRHRVERLVAEPLFLEGRLDAATRRDRVAAALAEVAIDPEAMDRYPHEFSGGQRQRIAIARALVTRPDLLIADEPVSALDVSIRARVLDLLAELQTRLGIAMLFVSHDLGVVRAICDDVLVMDAGRIVERGPVEDVLTAPRSPAARRLVDATPNLERALERSISHTHRVGEGQ